MTCDITNNIETQPELHVHLWRKKEVNKPKINKNLWLCFRLRRFHREVPEAGGLVPVGQHEEGHRVAARLPVTRGILARHAGSVS